MDRVALMQWIDVLDLLTYYELFCVPATSTYDDLRSAFHLFADTFHPDGHRWRAHDEQDAIGRIYRRGTEAWRILSDPTLRARYDDAVAHGVVRPEELLVEIAAPRASLAPPPPGGGRLIDKVRAPGARPFVLRAEELMKKGDPKQAKIQLVMALHMDKGNPALEAFAKELDAAIAARPSVPPRGGA
jgi:curved DNA-binding protein CbpA